MMPDNSLISSTCATLPGGMQAGRPSSVASRTTMVRRLASCPGMTAMRE